MDKYEIEEEIKKNKELLEETEDELGLLLNTSGQHVSSKKITNISMEYETKIKKIKEEIIRLQEMMKN